MMKFTTLFTGAVVALGSEDIQSGVNAEKIDDSSLVSESNSDNDIFEMSLGKHGCRVNDDVKDPDVVSGYRMGRCYDYISVPTSRDESHGTAYSKNLRKPNNGGFPIWQRFLGHGCKGTPDARWRMDKRSEGFRSDYETGKFIYRVHM